MAFFLFWAYLWGIETDFSSFSTKKIEDWFWAYLWGIETIYLNKFYKKTGGFWAYLWGIETAGLDMSSSVDITGFEPTYEGLKPHILIFVKYIILLYCFEPTYEGLKL